MGEHGDVMLIDHVTGGRNQQPVGEDDLTQVVLVGRIRVVGAVEDRRLITEGNRLEEIGGEEDRGPRRLPVSSSATAFPAE